ncbi:unnamed protein product [Dovyalis caffra]|uniref:SAM-dependent MTase DRM-type domain-containing protein n=1 Tax=Dovyalis caffra TaxID=77055 RepID=A0AAV1SLG2_9ROSI|nr:unnamed protein product [Dovyalis caffra]
MPFLVDDGGGRRRKSERSRLQEAGLDQISVIDDVDGEILFYLKNNAIVIINNPTYPNSQSSNSLDCLFNDNGASNPPKYSIVTEVKDEPDVFYDDKGLLIEDEFPARKVEFAMDKLAEFVDARLFSTLRRREGYIHNLPTENRFHILPKPPITLEDLTPSIKKWWSSWDARKKLVYGTRKKLIRQLGFDPGGCDNLEDKVS